ncbi:MAG TPA: hypothetical protein VFQ84_04910 [Arenimonas sp.]|uniref:hypothetical protein n=1 Tax=Arenimonas sp. TaxID=1872635 RepID=UPI002D7E70A2|nr:hypothetical protein [Arenimonas sp.]HEU0152667.1 hypothetical protein [Arenimonas sp.]
MFDLARFLRLARAQWSEQRRTWLWFLGVTLILHFVLLLIDVLLSDEIGRDHSFTHAGQMGIYFLGLVVTAPVFAGRYFLAMARPESAGVLLMRPASLFEKWLLAAVVVLVAYPLAYSLLFNVLNVPMALYAQAAHEALAASQPVDSRNAEILGGMDYRVFLPWQAFEEDGAFATIFLMLASAQGFAVLGSLYFRAMPFIKTVLAAFLLLLAIILSNSLVGSHGRPFLEFWGSEPLQDWRHAFLALAWFGVPGLLWLASLFALQEREVA